MENIIINDIDGELLYEGTHDDLKEAVEYCAENNVDLEYADLSGADLSQSDLSNAKLYGADLSGADIRYCWGDGVMIENIGAGEEWMIVVCTTSQQIAINNSQTSFSDF